MIKTTYQTPELRDANDNVVQEGSFGKNTALANSTNDGWIDYVMNDLEALHDTIGYSAATLDGNGHVVEPANLAIGDEDGNRLKTSYLKLTGGTVSGTLNVAQNVKFQDNQENVFGGVYVPSSSATEQYAQFYGGESISVAGAKLTLYPDGDGRFKLDARSTDGANTYTLVTDNNGNLNWRGYPLAWKKDYLPLSGGTMTGDINYGEKVARFSKYNNISSICIVGSSTDSGIGILSKRSSFNDSFLILSSGDQSTNPRFRLSAGNGTTSKELVGKPNGTLTWGGKNIERIESSGTNYIRYVSGLQICWGRVTGAANTTSTAITFPQAFKDSNSYYGHGNIVTSSITINSNTGSYSTTGMTVYHTSVNANVSIEYIAIGFWK